MKTKLSSLTSASLSLLASLSLSAAATFGGCATPPPVIAPGLALHKVVIYRNGVGYFERGGRVTGNRVEFKVRKDEVGDFLATLAVLERGGSSVRSAAFPLDVDDGPNVAPDEETLPPSPRTTDGNEMIGPAPSPARPDRGRLRTVVMSLDGKEHDLQVGYIASTPVWRPSYRLVIDKDGANLQTWGIVQNLSGEDWNGVTLSLVAEAPLAFDASLGTAVIPPRPQVTDGGDVIAVVPRSETSLAQDAPAPPTPPEETIAAEADEPALEGFAGGAAVADRRKAKKGSSRDRQAEAAAPMASMAAKPMGGLVGRMAAPKAAPAPYSRQTRNVSALAAVATQAGTTRYDLPATVTIPDRSATMVMLLDQHIPGEAVALFAPDPGVPDSSAHPFRVARYLNKTGGLLERGPLAIFANGAFLGQGMADPLPDGATATVPFALERGLAVDVSRESREEGSRLAHIEGGGLSIARDSVWLTKYRVRNGSDRAMKLLLKHQRVAGARLHQPPKDTEDNVGTNSALVPSPVAPRTSIEVVVDERQDTTRGVDWFEPLADDAVTAYIADRRADPTVVQGLKAAWEIRKTLMTANDQRIKWSGEQSERQRATEETRANLKALEKNKAAGDLRTKLTSRLAGDSAKLDDLAKKLIEVNLRIAENQVRFTEAIRSIKLMQPLAVE